MKRFRIFNCCIISVSFLLAPTLAESQDIHFAQVQNQKIWYNPALKVNKDVMVHAGIRKVNYPGIMDYNSEALTVELPMMRGEADEQDNRAFANLAIGIDADNSSNLPVKVSAGMIGLSWALPLNYDNTYIAAGLQGAYSFSRIAYDGYLEFPNNFDAHGPVEIAIRNDPDHTGFTYQYFAVGAGAAVFHSGQKRQWYVGGSIRHFNQPLTDKYDRASYRLARNYGIQGGYSTVMANKDVIGGYSNFSWQDGAYEHLIKAQYTHNLQDSTLNAFTVGIGYRTGAAIIPNAELKIKAYRIGFFYEFNISRAVMNDYHRRAFEFSIMVNW